MKVCTFNILTNGSGAYNSSTDGGAVGVSNASGPLLVYAVEYTVGTLSAGVGCVLSVDTPQGVNIIIMTLTAANANALYYPRRPAHDNVGTALTTWFVPPLVHGVLKLVVASGGSAKTGKLVVHLASED
jgi:hypothetical protein